MSVKKCSVQLLCCGLAWAVCWTVAQAAVGTPQRATDPAMLTLQEKLVQAGAAFQKEHPEIRSFDPENLEVRQRAMNLWHEKMQAITREYGGALLGESRDVAIPTQQGSVPSWPRAAQSTDEKQGESTSRSVSRGAAAMLPNDMMTPLGFPPSSVNASVAFHGITGGEAYGVVTDFFLPPLAVGAPVSLLAVSGTPVAGGGAPWFPLGGVATAFGSQWNGRITYNSPVAPIAYYETHVDYGAPALGPASPTAIIVGPSLGAGAVFPTGGPMSFVYGAPGPGFWEDYPYIVADNHPGNPLGPGGRGDAHIAWVEYAGGAPDANGNGVWYDDPGDGYVIGVASTNSLPGPFLYPAFTPPIGVFGGPVMPGMHQLCRPSLDVAGPAGTPAGPPSTVYLAFINPATAMIMVTFSPPPGLGPAYVPPLPAVPVAFLPPVLAPGLKASSSVSIAVDDGPTFPGMVYLAWSDFSLGDADIMFSASPDGGITWFAPLRVNQDAPGNGLDQWAPDMKVNAVTGEIIITYFDRRRDPGNIAIETWASTSLTGGASWVDALVSDAGPTPPPPALPYPPGFYMGDYLGSTADYGFGINSWGAAWNDGRTGPGSEAFFEVVRIFDSDADGIVDPLDNCPALFNPGQTDSDGDGFGDPCDNCAFAFNPGQVDTDADGFGNACDNCPEVFNPTQAITVGLTGDLNGSGTLTSSDVILLVNYVFKGGAAPSPCPAVGDCNCTGSVTSADIITLVNHVFKGGAAPCNVCLAPGLGWTCP